MTKLTDIQAILLTLGAQREDGSLLPPPDTLQNETSPVRKAIEQLIKRGLAAEVEVTEPAKVWRDGGDLRFGAVITVAGKQAIGIVTPSASNAAQEDEVGQRSRAAPPPSSPRADSKQGKLIELLQRDAGASLDELVAATSWLPHTTRAALTGLRKKGHAIGKEKIDGVTRYRIAAGA